MAQSKVVILVTGLPGSGKTHFSRLLKQRLENVGLTVDWFNENHIRDQYQDWDHSREGQIRQRNRLHDLVVDSKLEFVIYDFHAPVLLDELRMLADWTVFMDTVSAKQQTEPDENIIEFCNFRITEKSAEKWSNVVCRHICDHPTGNQQSQIKLLAQRTPAQLSFRQNPDVMVCRKDSLVYLRTLKCASTFFYQSFLAAGWSDINFEDIDWDTDHVFSHMLYPETRRHKGIAEYIFISNLEDQFENSQEFRDFVRWVPMLDHHSSSYHDVYGDHCQDIDWIPLNRTTASSIHLTEKLLESHSIVPVWQLAFAHESDDRKKKIEKQLETIWLSNGEYRPPHADRYFDRDIELYQTVCNRFNDTGQTWADCSWLRKD